MPDVLDANVLASHGKSTTVCDTKPADPVQPLPDGLLSLVLWGTELLPADYLELRRFASLQRLKVRTARHTFLVVAPRDTPAQRESAANAIAAAIAPLPLREFEFYGSLTRSLVRQLGVQPGLRKLLVNAMRIPSLDELATAPVM
ncbi:MAG: hypothetical protein ACJAYX_004913 [Planctomycetota bacterium]|jgi:hypothetical protein